MNGGVRAFAMAAVPALALLAAGCGGASPTAALHPIDRIARSADTLLVGGMVFPEDGEDVRIESRCSGPACAFASRGEDAGEASVSGLTEGFGGEWPAATETARGVSLARVERIGAVGERTPGDRAWAGWLDHSAFLAGHGTLAEDGPGNRVAIPLAASFGDATGTNPAAVAGSAAWSGVMTGTDMGAATGPREIRGDAGIVIPALANPSVEVAFTNVRELGTGDARDDMSWRAIPLADGRFGAGSAGDAIAGAFYGPGHREVGGVFERGRVFGAFGAKRR